MFFIFSIICFILSLIIKLRARKIKKSNNIQDGKITYTDLNKPSKPFFSKKYRLAGKPDYIVEKNGIFYPVEYKAGNHNFPLKNHVLQLASYCHLIEENYGGFVPYGILVYDKNKSFKIPYNPAVRFELESNIQKIRTSIKTGRIKRNHSNRSKCKYCSMKEHCDDKII